VLYNVFGRLVAIVFPLHVDSRTSDSDYPQVIRSVWRLLDVQLYQLLISAVHVTCLTHIRSTVVYLHVTDLQRSDNFFAKRLLSFCKSTLDGNKKIFCRASSCTDIMVESFQFNMGTSSSIFSQTV